jgi:hypothetical protein
MPVLSPSLLIVTLKELKIKYTNSSLFTKHAPILPGAFFKRNITMITVKMGTIKGFCLLLCGEEIVALKAVKCYDKIFFERVLAKSVLNPLR